MQYKILLIPFFISAAYLPGQISVVSNDASWPANAVVDSGAPGTAMVTQLGVAHTLDYDGERDVKNQRPIMQTFNLPANISAMDLTDIYVYYWGGTTTAGGTTDTIDVLIFEIDDVFAAGGVSTDDDITSNPPPNAGNGGLPIYSGTVTVGPASLGDRETSRHVLHLSLADGPTLTRRPGNAGYGLMLYNADTDNVFPFKWSAERNPYANPPTIDQGPYLPGRPYSDNPGSFQESHDLSIALNGPSVPAATLISITDAPASSAVLEVATGHFDTHSVEGSSTLSSDPSDWTVLDTIEGDGTTQQTTVTRPGSPYFYRVSD